MCDTVLRGIGLNKFEFELKSIG